MIRGNCNSFADMAVQSLGVYIAEG